MIKTTSMRIWIIVQVLICFLITFATTESYAQFRNNKRPAFTAKKPNKKSSFLDTQWWLGLRTGINLSEAIPQTRFAVYSPINYETQSIEKSYHGFKKMGMQAGIDVTFYHIGLSFSLIPNYRRQKFMYENQYTRANPAMPDQSLELYYEQIVSTDYIDFPLSVKYDVRRQGKWRPFVLAGAYYGILAGADKRLSISGKDQASGGVNTFEGETLQVGAHELFIKSSAGLLGGVGVNYDLWKIRVVFDIVYRHGLHNISDVNNRYANNSLSALGDTMDDITVNNLSFNLGFLFPLRFISKDFSAID